MSLLTVTNVVKEFPGVRALDGVSFELQTGEVHAICGENGAGKSTLMKILSGLYPHGTYSGEFSLENNPMCFQSSRESKEAGIAIVYQELALAPNLNSVANIFLGDESTRGGLLDEKQMLQETQRLFELFELKFSPQVPLSELRVGECQLVEIAKAVRRNPKVLILDEPTSALTDTETEIFFRVLRKLAQQGMGIIIITHRLNEIYAIAQQITVLRDGKTVGSWPARELSKDALIEAMVGRQVKDQYPQKSIPQNETVMKVAGWTVKDLKNPSRNFVSDVSFELRRGEILGISGLMGAGRTELLLSLVGALPHSQGQLTLDGESVQIHSPQQALRQGMALVSEDRKQLGLLLEWDVVRNLTLSSLNKYSTLGFLEDAGERKSAQEYVSKLFIKTSNVNQTVGHLSGGNQQKVVLAKCLNVQPRILLMDEPTRGIDIGARQEIYQLIRQLAESGLSVLVASSEIPELMGLCHRILVLCDGRLTGNFTAPKEEQLMEAATRFERVGMENVL